MFTTMKSRIAVVLSGAWALGAVLWTDRIGYWQDDLAMTIVIGWAAIWLAVYGAFWIVDMPESPVRKIAIPRWLGYTLIAVGILVAMSLPDLIRNGF